MGVIDREPSWRRDAERGDGLEVAPVVYLDGAVERTDDASTADAWSVFVHVSGLGVVWIADYDTHDEAVWFAERAAEDYPNLHKHGIQKRWS